MVSVTGLATVMPSFAGRLRLRTVLLAALAFSAGLPLVGTVFFRVYETTLVRQTEQELAQQASYIRGAFLVELQRQCQQAAAKNCPVVKAPSPAPANSENSRSKLSSFSEFRTPQLQIDMATSGILPERPDAKRVKNLTPPLLQSTADTIWPVIQRGTAVSLAGVRLVDSQGVVMAGRAEKSMSLLSVPEVVQALQGKNISVLRQRENTGQRYSLEWISRASGVRVFRAEPLVDDAGKIWGAVLLSRSPRSLFKGLYDDLGKIILAGMAVALAVLALALFMAARITRPLHALNAMTQRLIRGEKITETARPTAVREIAQLTANFHSMAQVLEQRATYIRDFATAVSHEFKTPLTGIRGAVELLSDHGADMDAAARQKFLQNIRSDSDRLSVLVGRLLELAKADMAARSSETCTLSHLLDVLQQRYRDHGLQLMVSGMSSAIVKMDTDTLDAVLSTLFTNSHQAGASAVQVTATRADDMLSISISDNGPGLADADAARLFTPFFTTRRTTGGTGLGLSIARSLVRGHGGDLQLVSATPHATFRLDIPVA
jgi:two-component system, OmpR family, sensor histidine kinase ChvG